MKMTPQQILLILKRDIAQQEYFMLAIRKTVLQTRLPKVWRKVRAGIINRLYRQNYGLTHNGIWDWGKAARVLL